MTQKRGLLATQRQPAAEGRTSLELRAIYTFQFKTYRLASGKYGLKRVPKQELYSRETVLSVLFPRTLGCS